MTAINNQPSTHKRADHSELKTIRDFIRFAFSKLNGSDVFYGHGFDNPWDEARVLVLDSLNLPLVGIEDLLDARLIQDEKNTIIELLSQRIDQRIPLAYLLNHAFFGGYEFYVDRRVIIPRSPLAELIAKNFAGIIDYKPRRILDLCTGSGCIAICMAHQFNDAEIDALDLSGDALEVAEINIEHHQLSDRIITIQSDLFLQLDHNFCYDLIVANPPYVDAKDLATMPEEYHHEPHIALASGVDGLSITKKILAHAADHLSDRGVLICEVGNSMVHLIEQFPQVPFHWLSFDHGGDGVFSLTKAQLIEYRQLFIQACHPLVTPPAYRVKFF